MEPIKTQAVGPFTVELHQDTDAWHEDPRTWATVATIVLPDDNRASRGTALTREYLERIDADGIREEVAVDPDDEEEYEQALADALSAIVLQPLRFDDHGSRGAQVYPVQSWADANAYAYTTEDYPLGITDPDHVHAAIVQEVETLSAWLSGEVYGWAVVNAEGEHVESCWGYVGEDEYAWSEGLEMAEHLVKQWQQAPDTLTIDADELHKSGQIGGVTINGVVYDIESHTELSLVKRPV